MTAIGTALAVSVFAPGFAGADPVGDVLGGLGIGGGSGGSGGGGGPSDSSDAGTRAGTPPSYVPPMHGTNPHGQGTVATVDVNPSNSNPYPGIPPSGQEEVVIGSSRGEQNGDNYHGRVTLAYVNLVPLIGPIDIHIESNEGQTTTGPTGPLNTALGDLCTGSGGAVCLAVLPMSSSTNNNGSQNSFAVATFNGGAGGVGVNNAAVGSSSGNIQENSNCQTASGSSSLAHAEVVVPGLPLGQPTADVMSSSSSSTACNNGQRTTTNDSNTLALVGNGIPVPAAGCPGPNEAPNTTFLLPLGLGGIVCNANDTTSGQNGNPFGVREALSPIVNALGILTVRVAAAGSESHAVAPGASNRSASNKKNPNNQKGSKGKGEREQGEAGGAAAGEATAGGGDTLPFTGENLLLLGLIGLGLIGLGLFGTAARERRTV